MSTINTLTLHIYNKITKTSNVELLKTLQSNILASGPPANRPQAGHIGLQDTQHFYT